MSVISGVKMPTKIRSDGLFEMVIAPGDIKDYGFDWSDELSPEAIVTSTWTITPTLSLTNDSTGGYVTRVYVNNPVVNKSYMLTNTVETPTLRESRTIVLVCRPVSL